MYKNAKNVGRYMIGNGALQQLDEVILPLRDAMPDAPALFFIDHHFASTEMAQRLPILEWDGRFYIDTATEPTCESVDHYAELVKKFLAGRQSRALIAIGGGSTMDTCKAIGTLLTNPGGATDYLGWDLVKNPSPYKIAVPTLSGSGSESSRKAMIADKKKQVKLAIHSDYTMFDQVLLDPRLPGMATRDQYFYTAMETFIHCFEGLKGDTQNSLTDSSAEKALDLVDKVFLSDDMMSDSNRESLMIASYNGGLIADAAGMVQPLAAGLNMVLGIHQGLANCYALSVLEEIYPEQYKKFQSMLEKQKIILPKGICANLTPEQYDALYNASLVDEQTSPKKLDEKYKDLLTKEKIIELFKNM